MDARSYYNTIFSFLELEKKIPKSNINTDGSSLLSWILKKRIIMTLQKAKPYSSEKLTVAKRMLWLCVASDFKNIEAP